jgi:MFS family permease
MFGLLIGIAFGPVQASSRAYMARSVTEDEAGRYFGIYALAGRATSFLAPFLVATVTAALRDRRAWAWQPSPCSSLSAWSFSGPRPIQPTRQTEKLNKTMHLNVAGIFHTQGMEFAYFGYGKASRIKQAGLAGLSIQGQPGAACC